MSPTVDPVLIGSHDFNQPYASLPKIQRLIGVSI
jgi:hypothetical protein